jgi:hypothetical protein
MRSFSFGKTTKKESTEKQSSSVSNQPKTHVQGEKPVTKSQSAPVQFEQVITTTNPEDSEHHFQPNNEPEYPHGFALATITIAVAVSVFLVALVRNLGSTRSPVWFQLMRYKCQIGQYDHCNRNTSYYRSLPRD